MEFHYASLPVAIIFAIYGSLVLSHALKMKNTKDPEILEFIDGTTYINELLIAGLFYAAAILYPFIYINTGATWGSVEFLFNLSSIILIGVSSIWWIMGCFGYLLCRVNPKIKQKRISEEQKRIEFYRDHFKISLSVDAKRKLLHVLPGLVIIVMQMSAWFAEEHDLLDVVHPGVDRFALAIFGEVNVAFIFVFMIGFADYLRVSGRYYCLPKWAKRWFFSSIKRSEVRTFVSSCPLVLTLMPFLFAPMPIFVSVAFVSSISDAAASLVGRRFGRYNFKKKKKKTVVGYIAGVISTFLIVTFFSTMFNYDRWPFVNIIYLSIIASVIFFIIDLFVKNLSDNILNPLLTGAGMTLVLLLI
ncbi:MAG: hypothetical protein ACTSRA_10390 [Promethearchaeota archaeon]